MVIAKYIGDLLFDYECVVIPGLGGFIINDKPAQVNYDTHYFKPPFREIMFNPYLRTNDGLLLNYIAKEENVTYQEAKKRIDAFARACIHALDTGKQIRFDKVGTIRKDQSDKVIFIQDTSVNYNPNAFGLSPFISPAVHRITQEEKIKEVIKKVKPTKKEKAEPVASKEKQQRKDRRAVSKNKEQSLNDGSSIVVPKRRSTYRFQFLFILLLLISMLAGWSVMNKNIVKSYYEQYSSKIPVFYSNPGSYIANNVEIIPLNEISNNASALWLVQLFKNKKENNEVSLENDDLTFGNKPEEVENKTGEPSEGEEIKAETYRTPQPEEGAVSVLQDNESPVTVEEDGDINIQKTPAAEEQETNLNKDSEISTVEENITEEPETAEPANTPELKSVELHYFIIAGSFEKEKNAEKLLKQLKSKGYDALTAGINKYGMTRIAYGGFETMQEAMAKLSIIRSGENPAAWIMKK